MGAPLGSLPVQFLGQPPVEDQRLAEGADHDVARLQVPVQHSAAIGIVHHVADVEEPREQLANSSLCEIGLRPAFAVWWNFSNDFGQGVSLDVVHGVERTSAGVAAEPIDGYDTGVLQPPRDHRLADEPRAALGIIGRLGPDLFQGDVTVELSVMGDEDFAQPALGVVFEDPGTAR